VKTLFVHQNFPGQFLHLARALGAASPQAGKKGSEMGKASVIALSTKSHPAPQGVQLINYAPLIAEQLQSAHPTPGAPFSELHTKLIRAQACFQAALSLQAQGFEPDVIVCHPGWGEPLFLRDIWPRARLGGYCEFYYRQEGADVGFDPEFQSDQGGPAAAMRLALKNASQDLFLTRMDQGISPTRWQQSLYPAAARSKISVIHDGIDTDIAKPNPAVEMTLNGLGLAKGDEVITFVNRNLEPYRGYHQFMRALPGLLKRRPKARVIIVGGDGVSYGSTPPPTMGKTWREIFFNEVREGLDLNRVHFVGKLPYPTFIELLQLSSVHVYLTYPFVLSWSLLEAMACACPIVASDTAPVLEVLKDQETGLVCDFFNPMQLQDRVVALLEDRSLAKALGDAARQEMVERYDLRRVCLPQQLQWLESLRASAISA